MAENRHRSPSPRIALVCALLVLVVLGAFGSFAYHGFISYDDPGYVTQNRHVRAGWTLEGVGWAFSATEMANWHPLTWLSHMTDVELFGLEPRWHHRASLGYHIANTLLLFGVLLRMTRALGPSAFVAALFGIHPLHVESVAWIAERKDVLSTFFWMLTLWAYVAYAEKPGLLRYLPVLLLFALGLMAKPMLVTLPFVLLLLDLWPLRRLRLMRGTGGDERTEPPAPRGEIRGLLLEKLPLLVLSLASSSVTVLVQQRSPALIPLETLSLADRLGNAAIAYTRYLGKVLWPDNLSVSYAHPGAWPPLWIAASILLLGLITVLVLLQVRRSPCLAVGWLWFIGTLVPVIGVIQVGEQSMADRYAYVPAVGLFLMLAWGAPLLLGRWRHRRVALGVAALAALSLCSIATRVQVGYWTDSRTLFQHALAVEPENAHAYEKLGNLAEGEGSLGRAIELYALSVKLGPGRSTGQYNLGSALLRAGRAEQAIGPLAESRRLDPGFARAQRSLARALEEVGRIDEAIRHYREALRIEADSVTGRTGLGNALERAGRTEEAIEQYRVTLRLDPGEGWTLRRLAWLLATHPRASLRDGAEAVRLAERACAQTRYQNPLDLDILAAAQAEAGAFEAAVRSARHAAALARAASRPSLAERFEARSSLYAQGLPYRE